MRLQVSRVVLPVLLLACCVDPECGEREMSARLDVEMLSKSAALFETKVGRLPTSLSQMAPPECPKGACVLTVVPRDPWGTKYRLVADTHGQQRIQSAGPDKAWGTTDDIESLVRRNQ